MRGPLLATLLLLGAGCSSTEADPEPERSELEAPKTQVQVSGGRSLLSEPPSARLSPQQLYAALRAALASGDQARARRDAVRFPEVALELLVSAGPRPDPVRAFLARERQRGLCPAGQRPWQVLRERLDPEEVGAYARARLRLRRQLKTAPRGAAELELSDQGEPLLQAEAARWLARALLAANQPARALELLREAREALGTLDAGLHLRLAFLEVLAHRRAGARPLADKAWQEAAARLGVLLRRPQPWRDADLLTRLLAARPVESPWPASLVATFRQEGALERPPGSAAEAEGGVKRERGARSQEAEGYAQASLAQWRRARREWGLALGALREAEAHLLDPAEREALRLRQARVLISTRQFTLASSLLIGLSASERPELARPAQALLGTLLLRRRQVRPALRELRRAVEGASSDFAGRDAAEADLGLAYLTLGDSKRGLRWLRSAAKRFARAGKRSQLRRAWRNELRYLRHAKKTKEAQDLEVRLRTLEGGG